MLSIQRLQFSLNGHTPHWIVNCQMFHSQRGRMFYSKIYTKLNELVQKQQSNIRTTILDIRYCSQKITIYSD